MINRAELIPIISNQRGEWNLFVFFVDNHLWVNIWLQKLPPSSFIKKKKKNPWWISINEVFCIHLMPCVSSIAIMFGVHESGMWLMLCRCSEVWTRASWLCICVSATCRVSSSLKASAPTVEKAVHWHVSLHGTERAYMTEWMTDSDRVHSASI